MVRSDRTSEQIDMREIDLRHARQEEYEALAVLAERLRSESDPDDPPIPQEERVRQGARGDQRWRIVARERATGQLAGYTEVIWHPNRPEFLQQGDTAVVSTFQNRGLGRWLKAAMLEKVLAERPQVRRIRAGNAFVNEPMLKINRELGFRPYQSFYVWQVEMSKVLGYLESEIGMTSSNANP